jgi:hypothetical protein
MRALDCECGKHLEAANDENSTSRLANTSIGISPTWG